MSILNEKHFLNEKSAIKYVENIIWKNGKKCPHCQNINQKRIYEIKSIKARLGTHKCADCKKQFTVKVGTVFEQSHIPLYKWLQACFLMSSSKKGISSHQLHRTLEITYKSAWFLAHRIREAMKELNLEQLGGNDKIVESDETFIGNEKEKPAGARGWNHKNKILSLVERKGKVKSFHISAVNVATIKPKLENANEEVFYLFRPFIDYFEDSRGQIKIINEQEEKIKDNTNIQEKKKDIIIQARKGQGKWRESLIDELSCCVITKVNDERLLIASHIKPWVNANDNEKIDKNNGLLLTPTYDKLFDRGFITFLNNSEILISPYLSNYNVGKLKIPSKIDILFNEKKKGIS